MHRYVFTTIKSQGSLQVAQLICSGNFIATPRISANDSVLDLIWIWSWLTYWSNAVCNRLQEHNGIIEKLV